VKTYITHAVTMEQTVGFFPTFEEAQKIAQKRKSRTMSTRYFTLDGTIPNPKESSCASYEQIEEHCGLENYSQVVLNFH